MQNQWNQKNIPHKGWILEDVIDVREDGQEEWETDYETCMMCGNEKIRYVHIVSHSYLSEFFRVGCVCAEKMTNDYFNPKERERELRNKTNRRITWVKKQWKRSQNGNWFLTLNEHHLLIYKDKISAKFKVKIDNTFGRKRFDNLDKAKIAVFNGIEYLKEKGEW